MGFPTPTKRLEIYSEQMLCAGFSPVPRLDAGDLPRGTDLSFPLKLGRAKTVTYCHSQGRNIPSLRRLTPYPILEIARETAAARNIKMDDWLEITTKAGAFTARAKLDNKLALDVVFAQHGWTVSNTSDSPNRKGDPLATNLN